MIKLIIGGIGSGKTLSVVKEIMDRNQNSFVNFSVKHKKAERLKISHLITEEKEISSRGKVTSKKAVNWEFWRQMSKENFDIYLDEVHNILHSRMAMHKFNILLSTWLSQIRKMLGSSERNHLYMITQRLNGIDISARHLAGEIIYCKKVVEGDKVWIMKFYFRGTYCVDNFEMFMEGHKTYDYRTLSGESLF